MLLTMNADVSVKFFAPQIAKEFVSTFMKKIFNAEEPLYISDQHDPDELLAKFGLVLPA